MSISVLGAMLPAPHATKQGNGAKRVSHNNILRFLADIRYWPKAPLNERDYMFKYLFKNLRSVRRRNDLIFFMQKQGFKFFRYS